MLRRNRDENIAAYVVWTPELGAKERDVPNATTLVPDKRAQQFWNPSESLGKTYGLILGMATQAAWDVYFLFGKQARWKAQPPRPDFWMHQLSAAIGKAPFLDGGVFSDKAAHLLSE